MKKILIQFAHNYLMIVYQSHIGEDFGMKNKEFGRSYTATNGILSSHGCPEISNTNYLYVRGNEPNYDWDILRGSRIMNLNYAALARGYNEHFK